MWPRHTCDFSLFRIYADANNEPADYSKDNKPYTPIKSLKVSLKGVQEGDFTFIMGYPGRTQRFQTAAQLQDMVEANNLRVEARTVRQKVMWDEMMADPVVRLQYANKFAGSANGWKKWQGEDLAFKKLNIIGREKQKEADLTKWMNKKKARREAWGDAIGNIDNYIQSNPRVAFVGVDSLDGINQAVTYLKEAGHKKIGYLTTETDGFYTRSRYQAYQTSLTAAGFSFDPALVGIRNPIAGLIDECFPSILEAGATAVLCSYDEIAVSLMKRCRELKIRVPEQLAVIGFDDLPAAKRTVPPLTTIHQDRLQLGKTGFYALSCLMNQVSISTILLHPDLIVRGSTGPRKMEENL